MTEAQYNSEDNTATMYVDGFLVASLNLNNDEFENHEDMTEEDKDIYFNMMHDAKDEYNEAVDCLKYETNY